MSLKPFINVERHRARKPGRNDCRRPLEIHTKSKDDRGLAERIIAKHKQQFLQSMAYERDNLSPQKL